MSEIRRRKLSNCGDQLVCLKVNNKSINKNYRGRTEMFKNSFLIDLGEPNYCKMSIDSMIFHSSRCTPTNVFPTDSLLLHLWFNSLLVPGYFLKPNKLFYV
jgi:hypothetical protein